MSVWAQTIGTNRKILKTLETNSKIDLTSYYKNSITLKHPMKLKWNKLIEYNLINYSSLWPTNHYM